VELEDPRGTANQIIWKTGEERAKQSERQWSAEHGWLALLKYRVWLTLLVQEVASMSWESPK
jgi:hypothetical protein